MDASEDHVLTSPLLRLPLEMRREIYMNLLPGSHSIDLSVPPPQIQQCNEIGKLLSCCKMIETELVELGRENKCKDLEVWSPYGLVDPLNTEVSLTVTSEYRHRSVTGPVYSPRGDLNCRYTSHPWCKWCWIRLYRMPARQVSITFQTEDNVGLSPWISHRYYEENKADADRTGPGENGISITYASDFIHTRILDIYLCWTVDTAELDLWRKFWDNSPVEGGVDIPTGNQVFTSLWSHPEQFGVRRPTVRLFLVEDNGKASLLKEWAALGALRC